MGLETKYLYSSGEGSYNKDDGKVYPKRGSKFFSFYLTEGIDLLVLQQENQLYEFTTKVEVDKRGGWRGASINSAMPLVNFERIK